MIPSYAIEGVFTASRRHFHRLTKALSSSHEGIFIKFQKLEAMMKYPIGIQSFPDIRERGFVYVDKTAFVYRMALMGKYYFLSRPRRFGKSLLVSTVEAYFLGRKDLFKDRQRLPR